MRKKLSKGAEPYEKAAAKDPTSDSGSDSGAAPAAAAAIDLTVGDEYLKQIGHRDQEEVNQKRKRRAKIKDVVKGSECGEEQAWKKVKKNTDTEERKEDKNPKT